MEFELEKCAILIMRGKKKNRGGNKTAKSRKNQSAKKIKNGK